MVYLLFKYDTNAAVLTSINIGVQIALCAVGVGEISAAVETLNYLRLSLGIFDLSIDAASIVASIPEFEKNNPELSQYFDYFVWAYTAIRLGFVLKNAGGGSSKKIEEVIDDEAKIMLENKSVNWKKISNEIVLNVPKNEIFQSTKNIDRLYEDAKIANKELIEKTMEFAKKTNGEAGFRNGLKNRERSIEKINADYDGDSSLLFDIAGSKVVYNTVDELYDALKLFHKETNILKIKDRIQNPVNGYRDILMNIKMKNGHIVEFRLHLKEMDEIADGLGHNLYEQQRSLDALSKIRNLTREEIAKIAKLKKEQFTLYENAWNTIINK